MSLTAILDVVFEKMLYEVYYLIYITEFEVVMMMDEMYFLA